MLFVSFYVHVVLCLSFSVSTVILTTIQEKEIGGASDKANKAMIGSSGFDAFMEMMLMKATRSINGKANSVMSDIIALVVFNVGEVRRKAAPQSINNSEFFRPDNKFAQEIRE